VVHLQSPMRGCLPDRVGALTFFKGYGISSFRTVTKTVTLWLCHRQAASLTYLLLSIIIVFVAFSAVLAINNII